MRALTRLIVPVVLVAASAASAQDAKPSTPAAERKHKADPRALELVRRADATTYRPVDAGLRSLRCDAEYQMTNGIRYRIAFAMEAPGKSTIAIRTTADGTKGMWEDSEREQMKDRLDKLFAPPRLETELEPFELSWRDDGGTPVVVAKRADGEEADYGWMEIRFLADGPVSDEVSGASPDAKDSQRTHLTYERTGDLFSPTRATFTVPQFGKGTASWQYQTVDGIVLPKKCFAGAAGLGGTMTITIVDVNKPVTGPATLPPPPGRPTQEELDALDVPALVAKLREPFVGQAPDAVTTLRLVRALAKKDDDAKAAIPALVRLLAFDRGEPPEEDAPADFDDFHVPLVDLLGRLRPDSIKPLVAALKSPITDQREWAAAALGKMGPDAAEATDALVAAVGDKEWYVGLNAAAALRRIGCPAEKALPAILAKGRERLMGDGYADEAIACAEGDPNGDRKLADALVASAFTVEFVPGTCFEVIFVKHGAKLVPFLADAAKTADAARREQIARAFVRSGTTGFAMLGTWIDGDDAGLRLAALRGASWGGAGAVGLAPRVAQQLASPDAETADAAEFALVGMGASADVEAFLATRPTSGDDAARDRARRILERLRPK